MKKRRKKESVLRGRVVQNLRRRRRFGKKVRIVIVAPPTQTPAPPAATPPTPPTPPQQQPIQPAPPQQPMQSAMVTKDRASAAPKTGLPMRAVRSLKRG